MLLELRIHFGEVVDVPAHDLPEVYLPSVLVDEGLRPSEEDPEVVAASHIARGQAVRNREEQRPRVVGYRVHGLDWPQLLRDDHGLDFEALRDDRPRLR